MKKNLLPTKLGDLIDAALRARAEIEETENKVVALREKHAALEAMIHNLLEEENAQGARGTLGTAFFQRETKVLVEDWALLHAEILRRGDLSLLHRRVTEGRVVELRNGGEAVPGTALMERKVLRLRKI